MEQRVERLGEDLGLCLDANFQSLSGGMKRRALLGKVLSVNPSVLALDEPTNHMDIDSILWLESYLLKSALSLIFVTHDRSFLRRLSTRIVEVDLAKLNSFRCDYETYLSRKADLLEAEAKNQSAFDKKLSKEEAWLRQGVKARRTRNEGRVRSLKQLRKDRAARKSRAGKASGSMQNASQSGRKVISAEDVSVSLSGVSILRPFSIEIMRGDRIGIIGPNGSGKTTLIRSLLGEIDPESGTIEHGTKVHVAYFDQLREQLNDDATVFDNIADGNESVTIDGRSRHVITYLQDFLFSPERARASIKTLSGGERNRLLLAKLFTKPANLYVLDEPTNDLDTETLELLEERIMEFPGTLLLVSHDRSFLENTVTSLIAIDSEGQVEEHNGGYEDWLAKRQKLPDRSALPQKTTRSDWKKRSPKFSKKNQQELDSIPEKIDAIDKRRAQIAHKLADPQTYKNDPTYAETSKRELAALDAESDRVFARWEELEATKESLEKGGN
jgi:ATP-binding cassette subfamily F protein uup